jgi:hypothetical protein
MKLRETKELGSNDLIIRNSNGDDFIIGVDLAVGGL